jgi:FkbM family methyltransferase
MPKQANFAGTMVALNPRDPVVSGALAVGAYERSEAEFFRGLLRPGTTVIDVGANVGCYTALAAHGVGPSGTVIAFEPDPENFLFLRDTIALNNFGNVIALPVAASDHVGEGSLFLAVDNKGDHQTYDSGDHRERRSIRLTTLDVVLRERAVSRVDLVKIDVEGAEMSVLRGMGQTMRANSAMRMIVEFWPYGLRNAHENPMLMLQLLRSFGFLLATIDERGTTPIGDSLESFISRFPGKKYCNLYCAHD